MTEETNKCTACSCDFTDDEGGVHGDFGILPMSFCPTCLSCMLDMAQQLNPREWVELTHAEFAEILCDDRWQGRPELMLLQAQSQLKEKNNG
jgi:hypothetical protein